MRKGETTDILVVGGGIFGLACAHACLDRGRQVTLVDASLPGAGASGGPVGALSPHLPEKWNEKKAAQLRALIAAEAYWARIAAFSGLDPGYARLGRFLPLASEAARARAEAQARNAAEFWPAPFRWELSAPEAIPFAAPHGAVFETLSARIDPPRAIAALTEALRRRGGEVLTRRPVRAVTEGRAETDAGPIAARAILLAPGTGAGPLAAPILGRDPFQGVKGQAARLAPAHPLATPMIYADGLYIVPHADGTVGVGATSENSYADPFATDAALDALLARATEILPPLEGAEVRARWAGLRPRGPRPEPMLGRLPGTRTLFLAAGAFRTGFGMAPLVGEILAALVAGEDPAMPPGFSIAEHLARFDPGRSRMETD
ncbi:MAG: FAD-dependent oxidoreductase [Rhodovulum sulfidophilum]|uniref:FAD-dependent oxidoreductase n=1 Tax=Rhodovulum sulfidophilum TaxID=35806 RepID=A0A2W5NN84_RHOSU|nr:MAG: FAD-dependent oxidoreductase [Rhodovulum sulfidophilum]